LTGVSIPLSLRDIPLFKGDFLRTIPFRRILVTAGFYVFVFLFLLHLIPLKKGELKGDLFYISLRYFIPFLDPDCRETVITDLAGQHRPVALICRFIGSDNNFQLGDNVVSCLKGFVGNKNLLNV